MALGLTQPLTVTTIKDISWGTLLVAQLVKALR
jgi:hypothetical protein